MAGAQGGAARTGIGAVVTTAVMAVAIAGGAVAWSVHEPADGGTTPLATRPEPAATTTTMLPPDEPRRLRTFVDSRGYQRFSMDDVCGLVDAEEIRAIFELSADPEVNWGGEDEYYGRCNWVLDGTELGIDVDAATPGTSVRDQLLRGYTDDFTILHPDECPVFRADLSDDECMRIAAIPSVGDEAWITTYTGLSRKGDVQYPWRPYEILLRAEGLDVDIEPWGAPNADAIEHATEMARLIVSRLPDQTTPITGPCTVREC